MAIKWLLFLVSLTLVQAQGDNQTPTLDPEVIQSGSFVDGSTSLGSDEAAQAKSLTSQNNFINFCKGKTLTDGLQRTDGSCNGIVMGEIPSIDRMISVVITKPQNGDSIESGQDFNITLQVSNLEAGAFTNAVATYYAAPQQLRGGNVVGHIHVTVQDTGANLNPTQPLDPTQFAFFKGINDAGDGRGGLSAAVTGGLPAGNYRLCTLTSAANHQPVIMPVAQRGSQDDCVRFTVTGDGNTINPAAKDGEKGQAAAALAAQAVQLGPGAPDPGGNNNNGGNEGNNNGGNEGNNNGGNEGNNNGGNEGNNNGGNEGNNNGGNEGNNNGGNEENNNGGNNNGGNNNGGNNNGGNNNGGKNNGGNNNGGNNNGGNNNGGNNNGGNNNGGNNNGGTNNGGKNNDGNGSGNGGNGETGNDENGNNNGGARASASEAASKTASETASPASSAASAETPRGRNGKAKRGGDRLARLSRRRRFVA